MQTPFQRGCVNPHFREVACNPISNGIVCNQIWGCTEPLSNACFVIVAQSPFEFIEPLILVL